MTQRKGKVGHAPRGAGLGYFFKNAYFLEKV